MRTPPTVKSVDVKISSLIEIINSMNPDKYFKFKFQDFCMDFFFDDDEDDEGGDSDDVDTAFLEEEDFRSILEKVEACHIIRDGENKDLFSYTFSFGIFIFYSYLDFCLKSAYVGKKNMKRFSEKIIKTYFDENFPKMIFDYYFYIKRAGNSSIEQETILQAEVIFPFFKELAEFQFSFHGPANVEENKEDIDAIGESIKTSYSCYINTICLSFSNFINFLNSVRIMDELAQVGLEKMYNVGEQLEKEKKENENGSDCTCL